MFEKNLEEGGQFFCKWSGLSVAPKPVCGITQPSSIIAFYNILTSSLVTVVGLKEKVGKASKQDFDSMTTTGRLYTIMQSPPESNNNHLLSYT